ncbi:hypothetical protein EBI_27453 [Enterocytozoon bieneusi H348]|nr:hypothetical protein EBI_27453 [Enterocytozoon bieneusi H348]|eukprot:XP_002649404.1 hypothetical protein EBI_27453 [Enterocytozoon bieneusi H348]
MHNEFSETRSKVYLTLFKPPKDDGFYEIKQVKNQILVLRNAVEIHTFDLFLEAKIIAVHTDDFKISICLHKFEEKQWHGISGPSDTVNFPSTDYNDIEEEKPKNLWQMLEQVYFNGDAETKQAMIKSFMESNGEIISTNYKEVTQSNENQPVKLPTSSENSPDKVVNSIITNNEEQNMNNKTDKENHNVIENNSSENKIIDTNDNLCNNNINLNNDKYNDIPTNNENIVSDDNKADHLSISNEMCSNKDQSKESNVEN